MLDKKKIISESTNNLFDKMFGINLIKENSMMVPNGFNLDISIVLDKENSKQDEEGGYSPGTYHVFDVTVSGKEFYVASSEVGKYSVSSEMGDYGVVDGFTNAICLVITKALGGSENKIINGLLGN